MGKQGVGQEAPCFEKNVFPPALLCYLPGPSLRIEKWVQGTCDPYPWHSAEKVQERGGDTPQMDRDEENLR